MNLLLLFILLISVLLLLSCTQQLTPSSPIPLETVQPLPTLQSTITATQTSAFTNTPIPTPNYCPKETVPSNLLPPKTEADGEKLIAYNDGVDGYDDIYTMNLNGEKVRNITNNPAVDRFPLWSPDGKKIAFVSNRNYPAPNECRNMVSNDCAFEIFLMNRNGADMHQISKGWTLFPVWSPDSKQIAYSQFFPAPNSTPNAYGDRDFLSDIYVVNTDGSNVRNLTENFQPGGFGHPVWSPDSSKLAFEGQQGIVITNSDGLEAHEYPIKNVSEIIGWSPDGDYIYFLDDDYGIYRATTDLTDIRKLSLLNTAYSPIANLSPDGKWIAYSYYHIEGSTTCHQIRIVNTDTSQDYFVYDLHDVSSARIKDSITPTASSLGLSSISWMPGSNRQLIFLQYVRYGVIFHDFQVLFTIDIDGTGLRQINNQGEVSSPSIQP